MVGFPQYMICQQGDIIDLMSHSRSPMVAALLKFRISSVASMLFLIICLSDVFMHSFTNLSNRLVKFLCRILQVFLRWIQHAVYECSMLAHYGIPEV